MLLLLLRSAAGGSDVTVTPGAGSLTLTGYAPTVTATSNATASPGAGALVITGYAPTVTVPTSVTVTPGVGTLTITGYAPDVDDGIPDAGGADPDGAGIRNVFKKKKRRVLNPEDVKVPKSVEQELEEYLDSLKAKPPRAKLKTPAKLKAKVEDLTDAEREAMAYWALQAEIDAEDEEIVMLLLAA